MQLFVNFYRFLSSSLLMISGTVLIINAMTVIRSPHLKIDKFIGSLLLEQENPFRFHSEITGCSYISIVFGIIQTVGSLMSFTNELNFRGSIWINFCSAIAYLSCLLLLDKPKLILQYFTEFYMSLVANTFLTSMFLFTGVLARVASN